MKCPIYIEHQFEYDTKASSTGNTVFRCLCGQEVIEIEDGLGA